MSKDWATLLSGAGADRSAIPPAGAATGVDLHLELDASAGRRAGLERALRSAIRTGRLAAQTRLPSTRALATELGLARNTVSAAYDQLVAEGYLVARGGSGTVVAGLPVPSPAVPAGPVETPAPRYDLRPGSPDPTTFPVAGWLRASRRALAVAPASAYGYGDPRGRTELRTALAEYLRRARGVLADPERIVVTSGYVQALALLTTALGEVHGSAPVLAMEDPGLPFHREVVRRAGGQVRALPVDDLGARSDLLSTVECAAVVLTPAHQYPMGVTLHPARRHAATSWAREYDRLVIEDDYDGEFRYDRQPVGAVQGTAADRVAYVGTGAKTLAPALRLAWLVLPGWLVEPVVAAKRHADLHSEVLGQLTLAEFLTSHSYDRHVRACRLRYRRRRDELVARLGTTLRPGVTVHGVAAGLHALIRLPGTGTPEAELVSAAARRGLLVGDLASHWHRPGGHSQGLVVGYGTPGQSAYPAALDILARVLHAA